MEHEKLLVNDKITASCQTSMSPKHHNLSNITSKKKKTLKKTVRLISFQETQYYCNPFQSQLCPSMALFVLVALFIPSFHVYKLTFMFHPV